MKFDLGSTTRSSSSQTLHQISTPTHKHKTQTQIPKHKNPNWIQNPNWIHTKRGGWWEIESEEHDRTRRLLVVFNFLSSASTRRLHLQSTTAPWTGVDPPSLTLECAGRLWRSCVSNHDTPLMEIIHRGLVRHERVLVVVVGGLVNPPHLGDLKRCKKKIKKFQI